MSVFVVREHGVPIFEGGAEQVANLLKVPKMDVYAASSETVFKNRYTVYQKTEEEITAQTIKEHLFNPDGSRKYEYKKGYPNRSKDASCVRFTAL